MVRGRIPRRLSKVDRLEQEALDEWLTEPEPEKLVGDRGYVALITWPSGSRTLLHNSVSAAEPQYQFLSAKYYLTALTSMHTLYNSWSE